MIGALSLSACGDMSPEEEAELIATFGCVERLDAMFPVMTDIPDLEGDESGPTFEAGKDGRFVLTASVKGKNRPLTDRFACTGNMTNRTIQSVELNGVAKRPANQEVWKY